VRGSFRKACWVHLQGRDARSDVERIARLGFEEVLPNVVAVGGPLYPSRVRPQHPQAGGRDLVGEFVKEAKRRGLRVHAWIVSLCYPNPAFESSHRGWYVVNRLGVSCVDEPPYVPYYKWLCPSRPEVRGNLAELFLEVADRYEVDGLHFDYIRLPDALLPKALRRKYPGVPLEDVVKPEFDYCYCKVCRERFAEEEGVDPVKIPYGSGLYEKWIAWRARQVTETVKHVASKVKRAYPGLEVSAAVFPLSVALRYVFQDWPSWGLDLYHPMLYHEFYEKSVEWIGEEAKASAGRGLPVSVGVLADFMKSYSEMERAFRYALESGARGVTVFAYPLPRPELEEWVAKALAGI
jgi:uncharacterized lipoprotein YddW (UPF0748 family)